MIKIIPSALTLESAADSLKYEKPEDIDKQLKEFRTFGANIRYAKFPEGVSELEKGYILGLQVGRIQIAMTPDLEPVY